MKKRVLIIAISIIFFLSSITSGTTNVGEWKYQDWKFRRPLYIDETNGLRFENSINTPFLDINRTINCTKELRLIDEKGQEIPSYIMRSKEEGCKVAFFYSISPYSKKTYYVYYGNPNAEVPNYRKIKPPVEIENILKITPKIEDLDLGKSLILEGNYMDVIDLLENNCPDADLFLYGASSCYHVLGSAYYMEFSKRGIEAEIQDETALMTFLNKNIYLIKKSNEHLLKSLNLSWCDLPCKDSEIELRHLSATTLVSIAHNYVDLNNYSEAINRLQELEKVLSFYPANSPYIQEIEKQYNYLNSLIGVTVEIELIGDIDPLDFSEPEIKPYIVLNSKTNIYFNELYVQFYNQKGLQDFTIKKQENTFKFSEKLLLKKNNLFLFPFDVYESNIFNITPARIRNSTIDISIKGEHSNLVGKAFFKSDEIVLQLKRKDGYKFAVIFYFILLLIALIISNKRIKYMRRNSFQPKKLSHSFSFWFNTFSVFMFVTNSFKFQVNLINIILILGLIITLVRFLRKIRKIGMLH